MYTLTDFFQPFNIQTIFYIVGLILFFDVLGTYVKKVFVVSSKISEETRILNWLLGLSTFVFVWFLVGFIFEANRLNLLISMFLMMLVSIPQYKPPVINFKYLIVPIVLLLPFIPSVLIKASLAPYYNDELNYHFISPYQLLHQLRSFWVFNGGTIMNSPRLMDNLYILTFSLTHTYSVVRLVQFLIVPTALIFSYVFITRLFGKLAAFVFVLLFLSLPVNIHLISTIGYVDFPAHLFMLIGVLFGVGYLLKNEDEYIILSFAFWGMSIGTKYTSILPFIVFFVVLFLHKTFLKTKLLLKSSLVLLITGGYWYVKNFVIYGNPIYPFFFRCWGKFNTDYCGAGSSFFGSWTAQINIKNLSMIINELLPGNVVLHVVAIVAPVLILIFASKKIKKVASLIVYTLIVIVIALKYSSGFYLRYQQYLIFYLLIPIIFLIGNKFINRVGRVLQYVTIGFVIASGLIAYLNTINNLSSPQVEIDYFYGKINIYDWIKATQPKHVDIINWCDKNNDSTRPITSFDPEEGSPYVRPFLINCYWVEPDMKTNDIKEFWVISQKECVAEDKIKYRYSIEDLDKLKINNSIVCNSEKVLSNLYYYNYDKINK